MNPESWLINGTKLSLTRRAASPGLVTPSYRRTVAYMARLLQSVGMTLTSSPRAEYYPPAFCRQAKSTQDFRFVICGSGVLRTGFAAYPADSQIKPPEYPRTVHGASPAAAYFVPASSRSISRSNSAAAGLARKARSWRQADSVARNSTSAPRTVTKRARPEKSRP